MLPEGDVISELDVPCVKGDIYGLAWHTLSKIESKSGGSVSEALTVLNYLLGSLLEEDAGLAVVLYDKRTAVGMMLAYYILRKDGKLSKSRTDVLFNGLLDIAGKYYSWYDYDGEAIFALYKLSEVFPEIEGKVHLQDLIKGAYSTYDQRLREYKARDNDIESLLYMLWIRAISKEPKDLLLEDLQTLLDNEYMRERAARNPMLMVLYTIALSEHINRISFFERGKMFDKIKPILDETKTRLDETASILSQTELLDVRGKLELAKYKLELVEKALRTFSELERQKRKDLAVNILSLISLMMIHHLMDINIPVVSDFIRQNVLQLDIIIVFWVLLKYYGHILGNKMRVLLNVARQILDKFAGSVGKSG